MPELKTYLELNDPVSIIARTGSPEDPFKDRSDSLPVINGMVTLLEIPSYTDKVHIAGLTEIDQEVFEAKRVLGPNEFLVHYGNGAVQVHPSLEGRTLLCRYKGRGLIMYPASRIYALITRHPDTVTTLQDYIDEIQRKLDETYLAMERIEQIIKESREATGLAKLAADNANRAASEADQARDLANDAYKTTRLVYKEAVADQKELHDKYPYPKVGWTVQTYKDGKRYRYDGSSWVLIDIFGSNLQPANEYRDGLMSSGDFSKLKSFPVSIKNRVVGIPLSSYLFQGVQELLIPFPFDGEVIAVRAICGEGGETDTEIAIEKTDNLATWTNILSKNIRFKALSHYDDQSAAVGITKVNANEIFRLNVIKQGINIQNVTVEILIHT
ncbi:hypothetical protein [Paenibacillus tuaregi]|uniref:hypothetical protein n=1 Tax=Paenibacillus tuaregi TaxID=1816681 RepID=UPI000838B722|nr:hypothetical protein [Paenibacillus tuaregi]